VQHVNLAICRSPLSLLKLYTIIRNTGLARYTIMAIVNTGRM
jgi:hypothetical protein